MLRVSVCALLGLFLSLPGHAEGVDLWSSDPQPMPSDVSAAIYTNLAQEAPESCDGSICKIEVRNVYCESMEDMIHSPVYTCSYGVSAEFSNEHAKNIRDALLQAGFVNDCKQKRHCDLDPIGRVTCTATRDTSDKTSFACEIEI
jgi:hypothetical protein